MTIALASLLENNSKDFDCINVYVLDNGINDDNKDKVYSLCERYPCRVTFLNGNILDSFDVSIIPMEENEIAPESFATYSRLLLARLLPEDVKKVLYIDSDGLVLDSFKDLWDTDISDYYCAGVLQAGITETLKSEFWFFDVDHYVNAGFLYINLEKWRNDNVEEKFIEFLSDHEGQYFCSDQGVINKTFEGKIKILEPKYNLMGDFNNFNFTVARKVEVVELDVYSEELIRQCGENPVFVHFAGHNRAPWVSRDNPYFFEFEKYAKMCDCESIIQCVDESGLHKIYRKVSESISDMALALVPAGFLKKRHDESSVQFFRNEELKTREFDD